VSRQRSNSQKRFRIQRSIEVLALLDQYSELQFEGIATGNESWVCTLIESISMFACRREEVIPRLRPGISIKNVAIMVFFTARQSIAGCPP
jgi:hypothetical protein